MRHDIHKQDALIDILGHLFSDEDPSGLIGKLSKKELEYYLLLLQTEGDVKTQKILWDFVGIKVSQQQE
jgi:hypothetical protein